MFDSEVVVVVDELMVIDILRHEGINVGATAIVDPVIARALDCLAGGASVSEACEQGHRLLESHGRHPCATKSTHALARAS